MHEGAFFAISHINDNVAEPDWFYLPPELVDNESTILCPLCNDAVHKLLYRFHVDSERAVIDKIKDNHPDWSLDDGLCSRCVDYYHTQVVMLQHMLPEVGPYFPIKSPDDFIVLPTPLRLDADPRFTGKGVTMCFIDSGFYMHPDLVAKRNRVKAVIDLSDHCTSTQQSRNFRLHIENCKLVQPFSLQPSGNQTIQPSHNQAIQQSQNLTIQQSNNRPIQPSPNSSQWHGTMTTVVGAGDGFMSNGLYRSIAPDAELVLISVQNRDGKIPGQNIVKALQWVLDHHLEYDIRIVNMSISDDEPVSYKISSVDQLAEKLVERGVVVVAAAGNEENGPLKPPANSPNVITIGGINDNNNLNEDSLALYHSSYGVIDDRFRKPELLAQAIWIAAPILPGTEEHEESKGLHDALEMNGEELTKNFYFVEKKIKLNVSALPKIDVPFLTQQVRNRIKQTKYITRDYMHVDGTSFASPIVCSVIAQLLEAEPTLTPNQVRHVLFSTATRIPQLPVEKQGLGYIRPRKAILNILKKGVIMKVHDSPFINKRKKTIEFYIQNECAHQISLSGTFNHWAQDVLLMECDKHGVWKITIPMLPQGKYYYKFFIDDRMWVEDVDNPHRVPDGLNGWNSVLMVEN